jgi:hypothetical protein
MHVSSSSYDLHVSSSSCDMRVSLARHSTYRATTFPQKACECSSRHWHTFSEVLYTVTFFSFFDEHEHTFSKVLYVVNILYIVALCSKHTKGTDFLFYFFFVRQATQTAHYRNCSWVSTPLETTGRGPCGSVWQAQILRSSIKSLLGDF